MNIEKSSLSIASRCAISILALLSIGPVVTGLDLLFHFLPQSPAIQNLHEASFLGQALWVGSAVIGAAAIFVMLRRPVLAVGACIAFATVYIPGANAVWRHFTFGCWLAIAIVILSALGALSVSKRIRSSA